ncbi:MAG: MoaD/ThiS family protein [Proteobacteria bacterium]|nr:MoaD/ThiS family protein [Pseudomonadota bacterium]
MSVSIQLPPILRAVSGGARVLDAEGSSIAAALSDLTKRHPALALHFFDEAGAIRHNIVFLHDGAIIRAREAAARKLKDGDEIVITNALAGG